MRKILGILLLASSCAFAQDAELVINDLSGGKVDAVDATRIRDNSVSDTRNVLFDGIYIAEKRKGMTKLNTTAVGGGSAIVTQGEYRQSDGTRYHMLASGTSLYSRLSGSEFTVTTNTLSTTYPPDFVVYMNTFTVVDGVNNMKSWDTSTVFTQDATYQPRYIHVWQIRLWIAGDTTDGLSKLRCSEFLDPSDYAIAANPVAKDPAVFDINSEDGQRIICHT
ncbi:MAG TPA: hypothetical protein ENH82_05270 [bacterium]|nr:hypothetical protein [bacterium]